MFQTIKQETTIHVVVRQITLGITAALRIVRWNSVREGRVIRIAK